MTKGLLGRRRVLPCLRYCPPAVFVKNHPLKARDPFRDHDENLDGDFTSAGVRRAGASASEEGSRRRRPATRMTRATEAARGKGSNSFQAARREGGKAAESTHCLTV